MVEQAATVLGVTPVAARKRLERARARVAVQLQAANVNTGCEPA